MSQGAFGKALGGFTLDQVSRAERGENPIPAAMLQALAREHRVDVNWVLTGEGQMFKRQLLAEPQEAEAARRERETAAQTPRPPVIIPKEDIESLRPEVRGEYVPILAGTAAGPPSLETDHDEPVGWAEEFVHVPGVVPGCFALRVAGASMSPEYPNGCLVLVGRQVALGPTETPAIVFMRDDGDEVAHTFKMARRIKGAVRLRPLNEHYRTEDVPLARIVRVLGVIARIA